MKQPFPHTQAMNSLTFPSICFIIYLFLSIILSKEESNMKYPNAANGAKKLFLAEVLALIGAICAGISLLTGLLAVESAENIVAKGVTDTNSIGVVAGEASFVIFALGAGVLMIIAFIINIIGLNKASKDEENSNSFKTAMFLIIISVALTAVGSALSSSNPTLYKWLSVGSSTASTISSYFVLDGIAAIAKQIGDTKLADNATKMIWAVLCLFILGTVLEGVPNLMGGGSLGQGLGIALSVVGLVITLIAYVLYIKILANAKKAFAEA